LKGYTQDGLAKELLVSVSLLGEIERGNRMPTVDFLNHVAAVLGISVEELEPPAE